MEGEAKDGRNYLMAWTPARHSGERLLEGRASISQDENPAVA